jgi:choline dehydrogenase-like flavoprotein
VAFTDSQRTVLRAFCDTIVPSIDRADDRDGFWARSASDLGIDQAVEGIIDTLAPETREGLARLLDACAAQDFLAAPSRLSREQHLRNLTLASPEAAAGVGALIAMTLFLYYGAPDPQTGRNPNWETLGFPGPVSLPPQVPKAIPAQTPTEDTTLEADVVVVGSGAGGGVIAGTLAQQGMKVVVVEAAGYFNESDFAQTELKAYQEMYWRGGPTPTADGNVSLQAGTTLGGGTTINWTNCLRTPDWVREQWAREFGLEGVDGPDYDRHLDTVLARIGATGRASDLNGPQQRLKEGCDRLGWSFKTVIRNVDVERYSPDTAGFLGFGDQTGAKLSTEKTWLRDAVERDAEVLVRTRAQRVLLEAGRAAGVQCVSEAGATVIVRAPRVVVACGALESPALLLRSGIGGPAAGDHLRVHPSLALFGSYATDQQAWWGAPHAALSHEFADVRDGYGFLIEGVQYTTGLSGSAVPWTSGERHKQIMEGFARGATFIALTRDHGHGRVVIDGEGEAQPFYGVTDPLDAAHLRLGIEKIARLHQAAGAQEIFLLAAALPHWRVGDDLDAFIERAQRQPLMAGGVKLFSAHQMGSCRMGTDPRTSVATPEGELHDAPGVWIGDGSAFPTPSGTNPMISIMALAHRTAEAISGTTHELGAATAAAGA